MPFKSKKPSYKEELTESPEEEAAESPAYEQNEIDANLEVPPTEDSEGEVGEGVTSNAKVPEAFQQSVDSLIDSATSHQLDYIRACIAEREKSMATSNSQPDFNDEGM